MNLKNKVIAGTLALILSGSPMALAKGEQLVKSRQEVRIESLSTDYELSKEDYFKKYKYKYVDDTGKIKWFTSYLDEIDGYKRTNEKERVYDYITDESVSIDTSNDYAFLYYSQYTGSYMPFYNDEVVPLDQGYVKTSFITRANRDSLEFLREYNLYRLVDNLTDLRSELKSIDMLKKVGYLCYKPIKETEDGLEVKQVVINSIDDIDLDEMSNYLVPDYYTRSIEDVSQISNENIIIKRVDYSKSR